MKTFALLMFALLMLALLATTTRAQQSEPPAANPDPLAATAAMLAPADHRVSPSARMTLAQLETLALDHNLEIRALQRQTAVAQARTGSAGALDDPQFMYRGWGTPLAKPWDLNQTQHMFMLSQNLPGSGKRQLRSQLAASDVEIAQARVETKKRDVLLQVRQSFYALLRNDEEIRFHDEQVALARQGVESARIKYVVGKVPQQDMLKAQIALTRLVEHLAIQEQDGDLERTRLNTLVGRDPGSPLEVEGSSAPPAKLPSLLDLEKLALEHRPELTEISAVIRQDEISTQLAQKSLKSDYTLNAGYMLMPETQRYRNTYMAELAITLPGLNRGRHEAEIAEANAAVLAQKAEYESRSAAIFAEMQEALVRVRTAQKLADLYSNTLRPQARAVLQATVAAYQADRTDFLNLLDSQNSSLEVELNYIRAAAELEQQLANLERAVGTPLPRAASSSDPTSNVHIIPEVR